MSATETRDVPTSPVTVMRAASPKPSKRTRTSEKVTTRPKVRNRDTACDASSMRSRSQRPRESTPLDSNSSSRPARLAWTSARLSDEK